MSDFFSTVTRLTIINDVLYDALKDYALTELHKDGIGVNFLIEESDSIAYRQLSFEYSFCDHWTECQPEGLYDVLPCFLIFLGVTLDWKPNQFADFRKRMLEKAPDIESGFVKVHWETNSWSRRPDFDGTYETTETFSYDMTEDVARFTKTTLRDCYSGFKDHSKYHGYDWNKLDRHRSIL